MKDNRFIKLVSYILLLALSIAIGYNIIPRNGIKKIRKHKIEISMNKSEVDVLKKHIIDLRRFLNNRDEVFESNISTEILSENISNSKNWHKIKNNKFTVDALSDICFIIMREMDHVDEINSMVLLEFKYRNIDVKFPIKINR